MRHGQRSLVVLSGGLDSTVTSAIAKTESSEVHGISFAYGQRHGKMELGQAVEVAKNLNFASHQFVRVPFNENFFQGKTSLVTGDNNSFTVPEPTVKGSEEGTIPSTWVPQRNMLFLTYAMGYADTIEAEYIYTGFNAVDYSGYPDCRPEFVEAAETALNLARKRFVEEDHTIIIKTPIIDYTKSMIVKEGLALGAPIHLSYSCYYGGEQACGKCDSCRIRLEAFSDLGLTDPIAYEVPGGNDA